MSTGNADVVALLAFLLTIVVTISAQLRMSRAETPTLRRCTDRVKELETQVEKLEDRLETLRTENDHLMRQIVFRKED